MIFKYSIYICGSYESTTRCLAIAGQFPALLNEMHFSLRQITLLLRIFQVENDSIHSYDANQQFVKWTLYITLGNDFFYSYGSYRESTAELQGRLNLTVFSHRTLSSEIHFADHRSKPGIYCGCLGEVHLYNSFTVICDLLASNST